MARINKSQLTRLEIIQVATRKILENGYTETSLKAISDELGMSTGNLTFYFPSKEHLLAVLIEMLCDYQWKLIEQEAAEGLSSVMAICLELIATAAMCEDCAAAKDGFISAYSSPVCLEIIRRNDQERAKKVFKPYCSDWTDEQFAEAETLVSGIEYATLMTTGDSAPLETRIIGALKVILGIYNIPEEMQKTKIQKVLTMDYHEIGRRVLDGFQAYVTQNNEQALLALLRKNN